MESGGIIDQLGINWKLLLSQAVNFFILLVVLRMFVYKPLMKVVKKRNERIKEGLDKAHEADVRLAEVDVIAKKHLHEADQKAIGIIKSTQEQAEALKQSLQKKAEDHQAQLMAQAELAYKRQQEETQKLVFAQALDLVKKTLVKTVQLKPEMVDEALVNKAVAQIKDEA